MSTAPVGAAVRIFYDGGTVLQGDALITPTGRVYVVLERRVQRKGKHIGRQHLFCMVAKEPPLGAIIRPLYWYKRTTRRTR